jgi:hypothetical protein
MDLGVLIRCQSANERGFYRALKTLQTIQKERKSTPKEFVSQNAGNPLPPPTSFRRKSKSISKSEYSTPKNSPHWLQSTAKLAILTAACEESAITGEDPFAIERRLVAKEA